METNINNVFFSRIEAIADKWLKISETSHQGSASLNLNHEIFNRDLDVTNAKELDKAEMRRERYEKMKAEQAKSQNNLKSARDWDPNQTHPAEILDLDFSKHEPHKKVNWDNVARKSGESFMFCAEECPNEIAKRKERESEANKKEQSFATSILQETILSSNAFVPDFETTLDEFQASELQIAPKLKSMVESFVEIIDRKTSKIVPPPHSARILDPEKTVNDFNRSVLDVIERHEYLYSDSDSSEDENVSLSPLEEETESEEDFVVESRRKMEKSQLRPRAISQPPKSRVKCLPVIDKCGRTVGYRNTPSKMDSQRSKSLQREMQENKENISDDEIEIHPRYREKTLPKPNFQAKASRSLSYSSGSYQRPAAGFRTPRYVTKDGKEILTRQESQERGRDQLQKLMSDYLNSSRPRSPFLSAKNRQKCRSLSRSFGGFSGSYAYDSQEE